MTKVCELCIERNDQFIKMFVEIDPKYPSVHINMNTLNSLFEKTSDYTDEVIND